MVQAVIVKFYLLLGWRFLNLRFYFIFFFTALLVALLADLLLRIIVGDNIFFFFRFVLLDRFYDPIFFI